MDLSVSAFAVIHGKPRLVVATSAGGGGMAGLQRRRSVAPVDFLALLAADRRAKRVTEVLRRPIVYDGVDAGVEVGEPGAQHVDGVEQVGIQVGVLWRWVQRHEQ